jgi:hypothetical protein
MQRCGRWCGTLLLLATAGGLAAADAEPGKGSWLQRLQPWPKQVPEAQKDSQGKAHTEVTPHSDASRRLRAELAWKRRAEVCQKLREIAVQTSDAELERFADRLDQRAWDVYLRQSGPVPAAGTVDPSAATRAPVTPAATKGQREAPIHEVRP